ncbi:hypothetical protein JOY44_12465 [Phormidium sp. CLA17]|uniref:hypothetical protein n=1 Tax=Leptolyngbya sp. Cla-17 TaxID=2803751 RepID=UPI0014912CFA|nr:hypothetical protein [Leptolyngbya sp. Cla-17]MBM0742420.1 hypothetical protein [Leptolyngbya sp. Cla-17]
MSISTSAPSMRTTTPAMAVWNNREKIAASRSRLQALYEAVDWANDLDLYQWTQWFAIALEFQPDLIVELGRGMGNSTCVFTEAANQLGDCRVVSLCLSPDWDATVKHRVAQVVPDSWFQKLETRTEEILTTDVQALIGDSQRVLVLWDAHGFDMAEFVLGGLLPTLEHRHSFVVMHDISDGRYSRINPSYQGKRLWRGTREGFNREGHSRLYLNYLDTAVEQTIAIVDFISRNGLTLESADHSLQTELSSERISELQNSLEAKFFRLDGHWFYFSLNEKTKGEEIYFPNFQSEIVIQERQARSHVDNDHAQVEQLQGEVNHLKTLLAQAQADTGMANLLKKAWRKYKAFRSR